MTCMQWFCRSVLEEEESDVQEETAAAEEADFTDDAAWESTTQQAPRYLKLYIFQLWVCVLFTHVSLLTSVNLQDC